ncbi:MAG: SDR family NAD(P)-dependent oxidoreductase [Opitutales bacterium]
MRVLITGVSSGLGAGIARAALEAGAEVWGCSRREPPERLRAYGERLHFRALDLSDTGSGPERLRSWIEGIDHWDRVILNAGLLPPIADLAETPLERLRETMEVNVWGNKWFLDTVFASSARVDQVIGISSGASVSGSRGWNGYSVSKAAFNMLLKLYAAERPQTHFTAFAPGLIDTAMQDYLTALPEDDRFSTLKRLKEARGTAKMPDAETAGSLCWEAFGRLPEKESGAFVDIRQMEPPPGEEAATGR